jgi:coiled-coil domain-containing protein 130
VSEHYNSDPYSLSVKARKKFRQEKKVEQQKRKADDDIKGRYGLPASLSLIEDDEIAKDEAKQAWEEARRQLRLQESSKKRRIAGLGVPSTSISRTGVATLGSGSASSRPHNSKSSSKSSLDTLRTRIMENTARNSMVSTQSRISKNILPIRKG